jgi:hypothetical protein
VFRIARMSQEEWREEEWKTGEGEGRRQERSNKHIKSIPLGR